VWLFFVRLLTDRSLNRRILFEDVLQKHGGNMSKLLRTIVAGWGAKKLGGGCISTIVIFILLWWLLGHFGIFK